MAGSVWEWTSTGDDSFCVFRGGWTSYVDICTVSDEFVLDPDYSTDDLGFRVCR